MGKQICPKIASEYTKASIVSGILNLVFSVAGISTTSEASKIYNKYNKGSYKKHAWKKDAQNFLDELDISIQTQSISENVIQVMKGLKDRSYDISCEELRELLLLVLDDTDE